MDGMLAKGYAKKSTSPAPLAKTWYIPHHGAFNLNKPYKPEWYLIVQQKFVGNQ